MAGTDITIVAEQAIRRANEGDCLVLAFNGAYIPVRKGCTVNQIVDIYSAFIEKQQDASKAIEAVDRIDKYIDENVVNAHDMKNSHPDKKYYRGWDDALGAMAGILEDVYSGVLRESMLEREQKSDDCNNTFYNSELEIINESKSNESSNIMHDYDFYFNKWIMNHFTATKRECFEEGMRYSENRMCRKAAESYSNGINQVIKMPELYGLEKQQEQKHTLKFKVGDKVHLEGDDVNILTITGIEKDRYLTDNSYGPILFGAEDIWQIVEQKPAEDKELLKNILFQKKGITYDDYKCKNDPYVGLSFYELIKCLEEYDKERSNR